MDDINDIERKYLQCRLLSSYTDLLVINCGNVYYGFGNWTL